MRPDAQQPPARRLKLEKRLGDGEQDVVSRGLNIGPAGVDHTARRQRIEDRIGEPDKQARPAADEEALSAFPEIRTHEDVLLHAVVPEVINAGVQGRNQERLGLELHGERLPHLHGRRFDVERPHARKLHRRREVDRQPVGALGIGSADGQTGSRPGPGIGFGANGIACSSVSAAAVGRRLGARTWRLIERGVLCPARKLAAALHMQTRIHKRRCRAGLMCMSPPYIREIGLITDRAGFKRPG